MAVQCLTPADFATLENPGVTSEQIVWPQNAAGAHITVTRVTMQPGAISPRHSHAASEQTWIIEQGEALILLAAAESSPVKAGEVVRTPPGDVHGVENTGTAPFVYLAITSPPQDFTGAYRRQANAR